MVTLFYPPLAEVAEDLVNAVNPISAARLDIVANKLFDRQPFVALF